MRMPLFAASLLLLVSCGASQTSTPTAAKAKAAAAAVAPVGRYLAGDTHVHNDHSADGSALRQGADGRGPGNVSVADQIGQGVLNGLSWMPLTDHRTYDQHYDPLWESSDLLLIPGEECNGSPHCKALGAVDWLVQSAVYEGRPGWSTVQSSIWDAHLQGAVYGHNHPDDGIVDADGIAVNERANAIGYDVIETWNKGSGIATELRFAERQWNLGYRFAGVGGSDNHFRELWSSAGPGLPATQVFASSLSERAILQGLLGGRVSISNRLDGVTPTATLEADMDADGVYEAIGGDEVVVPKGTVGKLRVTVTTATGATVNVWKNPGKFAVGAKPFKTFTGTTPAATMVYDIASDETDAWYYVEVLGVGEADSVNTGIRDNPTGVTQQIVTGIANQRRAITAPVFIGPQLAAPVAEMPLPADVGSDDGAAVVIGDIGAYAGFPDVAVAEGLHHLVAERHGPGSTRVVYRRYGTDGSLGTEVDLAPTSTSARFPRIAAAGKNLFVVWQDERAGQLPRRAAIYLRRSSDGGSSWAAEELLRSVPGRAEHPAIALTPAGQPVVVWQEIRAAEPFDVFAQVFGVDAEPVNVSRPGKSFNAANAGDTRSALYPASIWPAVAVRTDGLIAIAYQDNRADQDPGWTGQVITGDGTEVDWWKVHVQVRKPGETAYGMPVVLGRDGEANRHPSLAFAGNGTLVAVWDGMVANPAGENRSVRYALSVDDGFSFANAADPAALAADPKRADGQHPRLGLEPDGRVRAVWFDNRAADWRWRTMTAVLTSDQTWGAASMLMAKGLNGWPATAGGAIVMASTRNALRLQRDVTQQIALLVPKAVTPVDPAPPLSTPGEIGSAPAPVTAAGNSATGRFGGGALALWTLMALGAGALRRRR